MCTHDVSRSLESPHLWPSWGAGRACASLGRGRTSFRRRLRCWRFCVSEFIHWRYTEKKGIQMVVDWYVCMYLCIYNWYVLIPTLILFRGDLKYLKPLKPTRLTPMTVTLGAKDGPCPWCCASHAPLARGQAAATVIMGNTLRFNGICNEFRGFYVVIQWTIDGIHSLFMSQ